MGEVLIKAGALVLIIVLGYGLKRAGFSRLRTLPSCQLVINLTLPGAIVTNFSKISFEAQLLWLVVIGIACNLVMIGVGYLTALHDTKTEKAFWLINYSGYNIGSFAMPYIQGFLGPMGVVSACMFDAGNAILCTGGTYSIAASVAATGEKGGVWPFLKKMFSSIPLDVYVVMLVLAGLQIRLPSLVLRFAETVGGANSFLAMLMLGIGFELHMEKRQAGEGGSGAAAALWNRGGVCRGAVISHSLCPGNPAGAGNHLFFAHFLYLPHLHKAVRRGCGALQHSEFNFDYCEYCNYDNADDCDGDRRLRDGLSS